MSKNKAIGIRLSMLHATVQSTTKQVSLNRSRYFTTVGSRVAIGGLFLLLTTVAAFAGHPAKPCKANTDVNPLATWAVYYTDDGTPTGLPIQVEDLTNVHNRKICALDPGDQSCNPPNCVKTIGSQQYCVLCK